MNAHLNTKIALLSAAILGSSPSVATASALWVWVYTPRVTHQGCSASFQRVFASMGMTNIQGDNLGVGGSVGTGRVSVICVRTPNSGVCNNGVTIVISAAMDSFDEAKQYGEAVKRGFGDPTQIDCG